MKDIKDLFNGIAFLSKEKFVNVDFKKENLKIDLLFHCETYSDWIKRKKKNFSKLWTFVFCPLSRAFSFTTIFLELPLTNFSFNYFFH